MKFAGKGQPLSRTGLNTALDLLGMTPNDAAYIWAIVEVETAGVTQGFGFRADRRPQILRAPCFQEIHERPIRW